MQTEIIFHLPRADESLACVFCRKSFDSAEALTEHMLGYFKSKRCQYCDKEIIQIGSRWFAQHDETHDCETAISGDMEDALSEPLSPSPQYMKIEVDRDQDKGSMLEGQTEDEFEISETEIRDNDVQHGSEEDRYESSIETDPVEESTNLADAVEVGRNEDKTSTAPVGKPYQCSICKRFLRNRTAAYRHVRQIHGKRRDFKSFIQLAFVLEESDPETIDTIPDAGKPHLCLICNEILESAESAHSHVEDVHSIEENVKRLVCLVETKAKSLSGESANERKVATKRDFGMKRFQCSICGDELPDVKAARSHMKYEHAAQGNSLPPVRVKGSRPCASKASNDNGKSYTIVHHSSGNRSDAADVNISRRPHQCMICMKVLSSSVNVYQHVQKYHKVFINYRMFSKLEKADGNVDDEPHNCLICGKISSNLEKAYKHIRKKHPSNKYLATYVEVANVNPSECSSDEEMEVGPDPDDEDKAHKCSICNTIFNKFAPARLHLEDYHKISDDIHGFIVRS